MESVILFQWNNFVAGFSPKYYAPDKERYYLQVDQYFSICISKF